jgi:hypothetical protein
MTNVSKHGENSRNYCVQPAYLILKQTFSMLVEGRKSWTLDKTGQLLLQHSFFLERTGIIHSHKTSLQQTRPRSGEWEALPYTPSKKSSPQHCSHSQ